MRSALLAALAVLLLGVGTAAADDLFWADAAWVRDDMAKAVGLYRVAALRGNKVAQRRLGAIYAAETSLGPPDYAEALRWYRLAAAQGDPDALDGLALLYRDGDGVPVDYAQALKLLHRAAAKGHDPAKYHLGLMYRAGQGVPRDDVHAYMWLSLGAAFDAGQIGEARDEVARNLTAQQIAEAEKLATECQLSNLRDCD
jgi:TPR repeat protein